MVIGTADQRNLMPVLLGERVLASANLRTYDNTIEGTVGKNEYDNHAGNICAGPNWKLLEVTTHRGVQTAIQPLRRRYQVDLLHLNPWRLSGDWFTDTLFSKVL